MAAQLVQEAASAAAPTFYKPTLLDVPISNNGARCRYVLYKKKLESVVDIQSPKTLGGLKGEKFLACNPQGKMPLLVLPDGTNLPESAVGRQLVILSCLMCEKCCLKAVCACNIIKGAYRQQRMHAARFNRHHPTHP